MIVAVQQNVCHLANKIIHTHELTTQGTYVRGPQGIVNIHTRI